MQKNKFAFSVVFFSLILIAFISCNGGKNKEDKRENDSTKTQTNPIQNNSLTPEILPGDYTDYHPNGAVKMKGIYNDSLQREGLWISYYDNGNKWSESYYTKGKKEGHSITFFPNGQIRYVGEYKNDLKTGTWTFYDEEGNISKEEKY
ncbi:MAG: hypothetical protein IPM74_16440 [Crocinitomicaceae bacterium]|nr:hypothetical protein [Crocinitomicaceae bacterium]MBK8927439.1 hypothetical protein [Crocinitomicaceae bacterium]